MNQDEFFSEFGHLALAPDGVARLRRLILDLAVRGRLVPQNPSDEPASVLLERIAEERKRLVAEKVIRATRTLPAVGDKDHPFSVPPNWEWSRFGVIADHRLGKTLNRSSNVGERRPYLRSTNVQDGFLVLDDVKEMGFEEHERAELQLEVGDLLVCEGGDAGRCALWTGERPEMYFQNALHRLRGLGGVSGRFMEIAFSNAKTSGRLKERLTGIAIKHLSSTNVRGTEVAVPPLQEQRRIVEKVDELMAVCDELEHSLTTERQLSADFADSAVATLVS